MSFSADQKRTTVLQSDYFVERKHTVYTPLNLDRHEIRLLQLQPGQWSDPISATLSVARLEDGPKYEAISYVWGDLDDCLEIKLHGLDFRVTVSQFTALRRLRLADRTRTLWIDATCIDQLNTSERGHQVGFMSDIYKAASGTIIWFGEMCDACNSPCFDNLRVEFLKSDLDNASSLLDMKARATIVLTSHQSSQPGSGSEGNVVDGNCRSQCLAGASCVVPIAMNLLQLGFESSNHVDGEKFRVDWNHPDGESLAVDRLDMLLPLQKAASHLYAHPWWSRVWTLQESRLPRLDARVHVGPHQLNLKSFTKAIENFDTGDLFVRILAVSMNRTDVITCGNLAALSNQAGSSSSNTISAKYSLRNLLLMTETRHASDERDLIYALLGLTDIDTKGFVADYGLSVNQVFTAATRYMVMESEDLRLLTGWLTTPDENPRRLPSWVPDYARRYAGWSCRITMQGFDSSQNVKLRDISGDKDQETLILAGFRLSTISYVGPKWSFQEDGAQSERHCIKFIRSACFWYLKVTGMSIAELGAGEVALIWRVCLRLTLKEEEEEVVGDRRQEAFRLVSDWLKKHYGDYGCDVKEGEEDEELFVEATDETDLPFSKKAQIRVLQSTMYLPDEGSVLFQTDDRRIGSAMPYVQPGDEVFIVGGSPMPFLLRKVLEDDVSEPSTGAATASEGPARKKRKVNSDGSKEETASSKEASTARQDTTGRAQSSRRPRYRLVSTCYVDGVMFGEAVTPETEWTEIEII